MTTGYEVVNVVRLFVKLCPLEGGCEGVDVEKTEVDVGGSGV